MIGLVVVEDDIQLAHLGVTMRINPYVAEILVKHLHIVLNELEGHQLVFVAINGDNEIQRSKSGSHEGKRKMYLLNTILESFCSI